MSEQEAARRLFGAAVLELRRLVDAHGAARAPVMREAMELTALLSLAESFAAEVGGENPEAGDEEPAAMEILHDG